MQRIVTNAQMKSMDRHTIEEIGIPSAVLMERAALAVVEVLKEKEFDLKRILILCGTGNNGGDGIAIGRILHLAGYQVDVYLTGNTEKSSEEQKMQKNIAEKYGTTFVNNLDLSEYTTIVDSVFGIGLSRNLTAADQELFQRVNEAKADVIAVDIPSGIDGDTGQIMGAAIKAKTTVSFALPKPGLLLYPGAEYAGVVVIRDIGIYAQEQPSSPSIWRIQEEDLGRIPKRPAYSNKGSFGKVLLVAGSYNLCGAAQLAARSCLRTGAGMVKVLTSEANRTILQTGLPEAMLDTYGEEVGTAQLAAGEAWADVIGIGPGMGTDEHALARLKHLLNHTEKPMVIDADALNLLSKDMTVLKRCRSRSVIVTPHLGEMARMLGQEVRFVQENLLAVAERFAREYQVVCVLKDARTIIALPDGCIFINTTGNSGMATAGSGDVLCGILSALLAQGMEVGNAAAIGVYLHGKAGDIAKHKIGEHGMIAGDLIDALPTILE